MVGDANSTARSGLTSAAQVQAATEQVSRLRGRLARITPGSRASYPELEPLFRTLRHYHPRADTAVITRAYCAGESTVALLGGMVLALGMAGAAGLIGLSLFPVEPVPGPEGFVTRGWVWPMDGAAPWVLLQAVGSSIAVYMLIKAYQLGEPSYVAVFEYSVMVFGPLFAWVALGQAIGAPQIIGIGLIAFAGGIIALRSN